MAPAAGEERALVSLRNLCWHLQRQGLLQHAMFVTHAEDSWRRAREQGIPAYLDRLTPLEVRA